MRLAPLTFRLNRRRSLRALAGLVVALLLGAQAMAATGCCWDATPPGSLESSSSAPACPDHPADVDPGADLKQGCPAEQPTPQARAVDVPSAQLVALITDLSFAPVARPTSAFPPAVTTTAVPPPPIYARLQRLRL